MLRTFGGANPPMQGNWLGVAFRRGDRHRLIDDLIMGATLGSWVHCELIVGHNRSGRAYAAFQGARGFMPSQSDHNPREWALFAVPITDPAAVRAHVMTVLALDPPYNYADLWQCCVTAMLPWETELDCARPESWTSSGVFCSQVALLFLRQLARQRAITLPGDTGALVEATHSRGCSPNMLFGLLSRSCQRVF